MKNNIIIIKYVNQRFISITKNITKYLPKL